MLILLCEDDDLMRAAVSRLLSESGHVVLEASDGVEALALMRAEQPDLVLLDMTLGDGLSGWEVAAAKKTDATIAGIPTLILSGMRAADVHSSSPPIASVLSDILLILPKPLENQKLLRVIDHIEALKNLERA